ncbi:hypothetical protein JW707_05200 [Candidatus Woesearchaeota archaeon]|nr:hypothetical protein [Candidatus Woesearchaeota archaeon]
MIYLGCVQDFDSVKRAIGDIGNEYAVPIHGRKTPFFVQKGTNQWETAINIGTCKKSFTFWDSIPFEFEGSGKFNSFFRVYEHDLERLLEGPGVEEAAREARETQYTKHTLALEQAGSNLKVLAIPAKLGMTAEQRKEQTAVVQSWLVGDTVFGELIYRLWEGKDFIAYDADRKQVRQDIEFTIIGDQLLMPEGYEPRRRNLFVPKAYDLFELPKNRGVGEGGADLGSYMIGDSPILVEHDEDGGVIAEIDTSAETDEDGHALRVPMPEQKESPSLGSALIADNRERDEDGHPIGKAGYFAGETDEDGGIIDTGVASAETDEDGAPL